MRLLYQGYYILTEVVPKVKIWLDKPVVHPAGGALAAHDGLLGEAAHAEGQPLEAVAELGAHDVIQDGIDGLEMRR